MRTIVKGAAVLTGMFLSLFLSFPVSAASSGAVSVSGWWYEGALHAFLTAVDPQALSLTKVNLLSEDPVFGGEKIGEETVLPVSVQESDTAVHYLILLDLSTSMPKYREEAAAFVSFLLENEEGSRVTIAGFGAYFEILLEEVSDADEASSLIMDASIYNHQATDIGNGLVEGINYLALSMKEEAAFSHLVLITDGIPYFGTQESEEDISANAQTALEAIETCPEILISSLGFGTWDALIEDAILEGSGLHQNVASKEEALDAASALLAYTEEVYEVTLSMEWEDETQTRADVTLFLTDPEGNAQYLLVSDVPNLALLNEDTLPAADAVTILEPEEGILSLEDSISIQTQDLTQEEDDTGEEALYWSITVSADIENGQVTPSAFEAMEGEEIILLVTCADGYETEGVFVNGRELGIEEDGTFRFTMPGENVEISAVFLKISLLSRMNLFFIGVIFLLLVLAVVVVILLIRTKAHTRQKEKTPAPAFAEPSLVPIPLQVTVLCAQNVLQEKDIVLYKELFIGSDVSCDFVLRDTGVSDKNTRIFREGSGIWIEDLNAQSITFVDGMRIYGRNPLRSGDEVTVGRVTFRFTF